MSKLSPEDRLMVLDFIETLFCLDQIGWPVDDLLQECGRMLDASNQPQHMQNGVTVREYQHYLVKAKKNGIPVEIFKQRMRRGMTPERAARIKYNPKKRGWKRPR